MTTTAPSSAETLQIPNFSISTSTAASAVESQDLLHPYLGHPSTDMPPTIPEGKFLNLEYLGLELATYKTLLQIMVAFLIPLVKLRLRPQLQQQIIRILTLIQILVWFPGTYFFVLFRKVFLYLFAKRKHISFPRGFFSTQKLSNSGLSTL